MTILSRLVKYRLFLLLALLFLPAPSRLAAQSTMPSGQEVDQFLASGRVLESVGPIPADFHRSLKEWYALSKKQGWGYSAIRLRRKNDPKMDESFLLYSLLTSGEVGYGDLLSRWLQAMVDQMVDSGTVRCYYRRLPVDTSTYAFSQGVLIVSPSFFSAFDTTEALSFLEKSLLSMGHNEIRAPHSIGCYNVLRELSARNSDMWLPTGDSLFSYEVIDLPSDSTPIVVVNPGYTVVRPDGRYLKKEMARRQLSVDRDIQVAAQAAGCALVDYSVASLFQHGDASFFNDYCYLSTWGRYHNVQPWLLDSVGALLARQGAHQVLLSSVDNCEGVPPTMLWSAAAIGVVYSPALVALGTHLFSHSENFLYYADILDYPFDKGMFTAEDYSLHDEHAYLRSSLYQTFCNRQGVTTENLGYLGHHFTAAFGPTLSVPGLASILGSGITHGYANRAFELCPSLSLEYAFHPNWSFAADFNSNATQLFLTSSDPSRPYHNTWNEGLIHTLGLSARYYRHQCEAPLGGYLGGGLALSNVHFPHNQHQLNEALRTNKLKDFYSLRLIWGRNYMFSRHFLFNYALTFDFPIISAMKPFVNADNRFMHRDDPDFVSTLASDIWYQNTFTLSLKLGFMP